MAGKGKFVISYMREENGTLRHATVSDLNGVYGATWTVERRRRERTRDGVVSEQQFKFLWNTIADAAVFQRCAATNPDARADWRLFHAVGVAFDVKGEVGGLTCLVPADEGDQQFRVWLETLRATEVRPGFWSRLMGR